MLLEKLIISLNKIEFFKEKFPVNDNDLVVVNIPNSTSALALINTSFDNLLCKVGVGVVDPYYFELTESYTEKQNAINVANSIMAVIENPFTVWHAEKN